MKEKKRKKGRRGKRKEKKREGGRDGKQKKQTLQGDGNFILFFKRFYLFLERGREKERVRNIDAKEKHPSVMCPDRELN